MSELDEMMKRITFAVVTLELPDGVSSQHVAERIKAACSEWDEHTVVVAMPATSEVAQRIGAIEVEVRETARVGLA